MMYAMVTKVVRPARISGAPCGVVGGEGEVAFEALAHAGVAHLLCGDVRLGTDRWVQDTLRGEIGKVFAVR